MTHYYKAIQVKEEDDEGKNWMDVDQLDSESDGGTDEDEDWVNGRFDRKYVYVSYEEEEEQEADDSEDVDDKMIVSTTTPDFIKGYMGMKSLKTFSLTIKCRKQVRIPLCYNS